MKRILYSKLMLFIVAPLVILLCIVAFSKNTEAEVSSFRVDDVVSYESVLICKGDTLWSIAKSNLTNPTNAEIKAYVDEIVSLNRISSDKIHTGHYILLPIYEKASSEKIS